MPKADQLQITISIWMPANEVFMLYSLGASKCFLCFPEVVAVLLHAEAVKLVVSALGLERRWKYT